MPGTDQPALEVEDILPRFAILVIHNLNQLWTDECCPGCCGPCGVIVDLLMLGQLASTIKTAPSHYYEGSPWWVDGLVDSAWLSSRWKLHTGNFPCPEGGK